MSLAGEAGSLYVGDLSPSVTEAHLFDVFRKVGKVVSIRVCRDAATRKSLCYAYVNFQNPLDAEKAMETMDGMEVQGKPCRITWHRYEHGARHAGDVFVKNLAPAVDNKMLHDTFAPYGQVLSCRVACNDDGTPAGYGFIHFSSQEAAEAAVEAMNETPLHGQVIHVGTYERKEGRIKDMERCFTNCFVAGLHRDLSDDAMHSFCLSFGPVQSLKVVRDDYGTSKGLAFVNFEKHDVAQHFIDTVNGTAPPGIAQPGGLVTATRHRRKAEMDHMKRQKDKEAAENLKFTNLYVKNIDDSVDTEMLKQAFSEFGQIISARVMYDVESDVSKGFGFVCFKDHEAAARATEAMNGRMLYGKPLYVSSAQRKEERQAQLEKLRSSPSPPPQQQQQQPQQQQQQQHLQVQGYGGVQYGGVGQPPVAVPMPMSAFGYPQQLLPAHQQLYLSVAALIRDPRLASQVTTILLETRPAEVPAFIAYPDFLKMHISQVLSAMGSHKGTYR